MSSKKIIRLKTPIKVKQYLKTPESTFAYTHFIDQQTVTDVNNTEYSENLHNTLINEINKAYKETQEIKLQLQQEQRRNEEFIKEKRRMKIQIQILERECESFKELYSLQRQNHQRLRDFYEKRQQEWHFIVFQHKKMLQEYDKNNGTSLSKIQENNQNLLALNSRQKIEKIAPCNNYQSQKQIPHRYNSIKKIKRFSLEENNSNNYQNNRIVPIQPQKYYFNEINRLYTEQNQFSQQTGLRNISSQTKVIKCQMVRNPETDDLFDKIIRKTYYHLREKQINLDLIKQCEDMLKLKQAKTSTKQRLVKTLKKLQFQVSSEKQLKIFCQYIYSSVIFQENELRGDFVFKFLIEKLQECEKLALSSNSEIQKIKPSIVQDLKEEDKNKYQRASIQRISHENLQLLLNSTIKKPPKIQDSQQKIRESTSSLQNLSDLINQNGRQLDKTLMKEQNSPINEVQS